MVWEEPGWMAQARQENEEYAQAILSCLAEFGVEGSVAIGGGGVSANFATDDKGQPLPGALEIASSAVDECDARVPLPPLWVAPADEADYQRMLDVRDCLIAQGLDVPEAPSAETWIEQRSDKETIEWSPYTEIFGDNTSPYYISLSDNEFEHISVACPQNGNGGYHTYR
jgi:hypothetical protein